MANGAELRFGELLVRDGLITEMQLADAMRWKRANNARVPLGQLLVRQKILTRQQVDEALTKYRKRSKLGEVLVRSGLITQEQLTAVLATQKLSGERLGQLLVRIKAVSEDDLRRSLSEHLDIPYVDLDRISIDKSLAKLVSRNYAKRHCLVPLTLFDNTITMCLDDPSDQNVIDELARTTRKSITAVSSSREAILRAQGRLYEDKPDEPGIAGLSSSTLELVSEFDEQAANTSKYTEAYKQHKTAEVVVRRLLGVAIGSRASDIHIETLAGRTQVRFRIDGVLVERDLGDMQEACDHGSREILSRLKILAKLDIAERRRPQDGSFRVKYDRNGRHDEIDLRLSIIPGYYGESAVLRVLDRRNAPTSLDQLHFPKQVTQTLRQVLDRPSGILLVTGPTGSGKSTTLYASLMTAYSPKIRVLTAEDPIEYVYDQFSQSEVNVDIGNTFANYLRSFLRHDPEVIMVGEIRDQDTAEMAFRAAQTGHLLLSTLHTNTAVGVVPRLLDMKIDPNSLANSLNGVVGQRLVRRVCTDCRIPCQPPDELMQEFFTTPPGLPFYKGTGCDACHGTGYKGRIGIVELWTPSQQDIVLISKRAPFAEIVESAEASTYSMADNALDLLQHGRTTLEELIRVVPYDRVLEFKRRHGGSTRTTALAS